MKPFEEGENDGPLFRHRLQKRLAVAGSSRGGRVVVQQVLASALERARGLSDEAREL